MYPVLILFEIGFQIPSTIPLYPPSESIPILYNPKCQVLLWHLIQQKTISCQCITEYSMQKYLGSIRCYLRLVWHEFLPHILVNSMFSSSWLWGFQMSIWTLPVRSAHALMPLTCRTQWGLSGCYFHHRIAPVMLFFLFHQTTKSIEICQWYCRQILMMIQTLIFTVYSCMICSNMYLVLYLFLPPARTAVNSLLHLGLLMMHFTSSKF